MPQTARTVRITQNPACILSPVAVVPAATSAAGTVIPLCVVHVSPSCKRASKAAFSLASLTPSGTFICAKINTSLPVWLSTCTLAFTDSPALYESLSVKSCAVKPSLVTALLLAAITFRLRASIITAAKSTVSNRKHFVFMVFFLLKLYIDYSQSLSPDNYNKKTADIVLLRCVTAVFTSHISV